MSFKHILLVLFVVLIWGVNFVFVKLGLTEISPLLFCTSRFLLASIPAIFIIKPPAMPFRMLIFYGLVMFALQFTLVFFSMSVGMSPGMASLIMQVQVFFTIFLAAFVLGEIPYSWQIIGALVSFTGIALVALHFDNNISLLGFCLVLASAAASGVGNLITKKFHQVNMTALVLWASFISSIPLLALTLIIEGPHSILTSYQHITWVGISAILYVTYGSTCMGYILWNKLLARYSVGTIVPFTLLVPIIGLLSSTIILGEPFQQWKLISGLFVISGLIINLLGTRLFLRKTQISEPQPAKITVTS